MLELEKQKFLKEQEEFKKQQQELLIQKQQQEQLLQKQQQDQLLQQQQKEQLSQKQQQQEYDIQVQRMQPVAAKRHSASPVPREKSPSSYSNSILSSPPKPAYSSTLPTSSRNSYTHSTVSNHYPGSKPSSSSSRLSKNLENNSSGEEVDSLNSSQRFSREQMLAMNRKATPMQAVPPELQEAKPDDQAPLSPPITREAPSKVELRSLNSVPRAKFRDPSEIYANLSVTNPALSPRQTEPNKRHTASWMDNGDDRKNKTFSFGDHWLVEEAERRRLAESHNKQPASKSSVHSSHFTGPIKPANDNRWRGGSFDGNQATSMPQAIRQTLLQKTSGMRGSTPDLTFSSGSSRSSSRSPSFPSQDDASHHSHMNVNPPHYNQQSRFNHSSTDDIRGPINGKQPCSHCNEEIGFGTAMAIEALGLFYHVQCFRCCVCHTSLGSGQHGADVRVRGSKLHCPNCYSNDEAGLKFSKV
ncbi:hypothetical protein Btru_064868 [Bulinus truncatus]|nr:hypothetical protein Btru_064868 [Bulinus truncatus]